MYIEGVSEQVNDAIEILLDLYKKNNIGFPIKLKDALKFAKEAIKTVVGEEIRIKIRFRKDLGLRSFLIPLPGGEYNRDFVIGVRLVKDKAEMEILFCHELAHLFIRALSGMSSDSTIEDFICWKIAALILNISLDDLQEEIKEDLDSLLFDESLVSEMFKICSGAKQKIAPLFHFTDLF